MFLPPLPSPPPSSPLPVISDFLSSYTPIIPASYPPPSHSTDQEELLDCPFWLGQPGFEIQTQHWSILQEQFSTDIEMKEDPTTNHIADTIESPTEQNHIIDETNVHLLLSDIAEKTVSLRTMDMLSDEAEGTKSFYLPQTTSPISSINEAEVPEPFHLPSTPSPTRSSKATEREKEGDRSTLATWGAQIQALGAERVSWSPLPAFTSHTSSSTLSKRSSDRDDSPERGSHRKKLHSNLSEPRQLVLLSEREKNREYDELFSGHKSNEEFLTKLTQLDEFWRTSDNCTKETSSEETQIVIWHWYQRYIKDFPDRVKCLKRETEEECEAVALEIQDEYYQMEESANQVMKREALKFRESGEQIDGRLIEVARQIYFFIKGKFKEGSIDDFEIQVPRFMREEMPSNQRLVEKLVWILELKGEFYENRYPGWLLAVLKDLADIGELGERQS